jgi:branched-chain amino acid transport system substrate-binding protein
VKRSAVLARAAVGLLAVVVISGTAVAASSGGFPSHSSQNEMKASNGKFDKPIVIGAALGKTGQQAPFDTPPWAGVNFAIQDINKAGGVLGQKITTVEQDSTSTVPGARTATLGVLQQGAMLTFQTCNYDLGVAGGQAANTAGVIAWTLCAASPKWGVQGIGPTAYTGAVLTWAEGNVGAKFSAKFLHKKKAFTFCDTWIDYSIQTCDGYKESAKQYGLTIAGSADMNTVKSQNVAQQITQLKGTKGVDIIYVASVPPFSIGVVKQIRGAGITLPIVSPTASYGVWWAKSAPHLNDYYIDGPAQVYGNKPGQMSGGDPRPAVNALVKRYIKKFGKNPDHGNFLEGYAATQILAQAMKAVKSTNGTEIANWIDGHGTFQTVLGPRTFTSTLHSSPNRPFIWVKYTNTWPSYVTTMTPGKVNLHLK